MGLRGRTRLLDYRLFFVTTTCNSFLPLIEPNEIKDLLIRSLIFCNEKYHADIVAYALMPEHLHLMVHFREENHLSYYMREFKKFTSVQIRKYWEKENPKIFRRITIASDQISGTAGTSKYKVWMDRFDDLYLYSRKVCYTKLRYINKNPVERGLCAKPEDYEYCSGAFYNGRLDTKIALVHLHDLL
jgi:putative transposase